MTDHPLPPDDAAMAFLLRRRSHPPATLRDPAPDAETLHRLLTAATRVPDHGKLEPWRFIVIEGPARERLAEQARQTADRLGIDPAKAAKGIAAFTDTPMIVAVIASPKVSDKIPVIEQTLSAGAVCLGLVNAALASGFGACWLTGWAASDMDFATEALGLADHEWVAGMIHLGTPSAVSPDRPRPDVASLIRYL
ncbi:nitroreductase [Paracoccus sp. p4-l81]|uniref:nitroreductase family protein n=1 Tax=unclassified Paracoccus (in: a-proteobacteria) TaxID=2688777 RepID=UPI0035B70F63